MLKKVFLALFILLLTLGNSGLSQIGRATMALVSSWDNRFTNSFSKSWPLTDAEEKSGKDAPSANEWSEEDDEFLSFKWSSICLSGNTDVCEEEALVLFKSIDRDIVVPPPRV